MGFGFAIGDVHVRLQLAGATTDQYDAICEAFSTAIPGIMDALAGPSPAPATGEVARIMDLVSVLEDRIIKWAHGPTPELRSIRADKAHAAQTVVREAITAALAAPAPAPVPATGEVEVLVDNELVLHVMNLAAAYRDAPDDERGSPAEAYYALYAAVTALARPAALVVPEDVVVTERRDDGRFNVCRDDGEEYLWAVGATLHEAYLHAYMGQPWDEFNEQARSKRYRGGS